MILILDYGVGNISSVRNMINKIGDFSVISNSHDDVKKAKKIILPGVGHYDYGMKMLEKLKLIDLLNEHALQLKKPILGICLGAQLLGNGSEEGSKKGLGWLNMECKRFPENKIFQYSYGYNC